MLAHFNLQEFLTACVTFYCHRGNKALTSENKSRRLSTSAETDRGPNLSGRQEMPVSQIMRSSKRQWKVCKMLTVHICLTGDRQGKHSVVNLLWNQVYCMTIRYVENVRISNPTIIPTLNFKQSKRSENTCACSVVFLHTGLLACCWSHRKSRTRLEQNNGTRGGKKHWRSTQCRMSWKYCWWQL